jgi:hypothetical protein
MPAYSLSDDDVRSIAREISASIISDARNMAGPVVWVTGNSYMPPLRSIAAAERVWQAANNDDGELWAFLVEQVETQLSDASVALECPDYDNALYAVDLRRWRYVEDAAGDDLNDEWEAITADNGGK